MKVKNLEKEKRREKYRRYGKIAYIFSKIIKMTLRSKIIVSEKFDSKKNYSFVFWHGTLFFPMLYMIQITKVKVANLVSPSKDGEIIAEALKYWGFENIRGSSNQDSVRSLVEMIKAMKNGHSGGFAVDGPKGPIYKVKSGAIYAAKKLNIEIVPLGVACSRKWTLEKSWDKFQIPKPFAKVVYIVGEPINVPNDIDVDQFAFEVERLINDLNKKAKKILDESRGRKNEKIDNNNG